MFVWVRAATLPRVMVRTEMTIRIIGQSIVPVRSQGESPGSAKPAKKKRVKRSRRMNGANQSPRHDRDCRRAAFAAFCMVQLLYHRCEKSRIILPPIRWNHDKERFATCMTPIRFNHRARRECPPARRSASAAASPRCCCNGERGTRLPSIVSSHSFITNFTESRGGAWSARAPATRSRRPRC